MKSVSSSRCEMMLYLAPLALVDSAFGVISVSRSGRSVIQVGEIRIEDGFGVS